MPTPTPAEAPTRRRRLTLIAVTSLLALPLAHVGGAGEPAAAAPAKIACATTYTVVSGDYWIGIAKKASTTLAALLAANEATTSTALFPGTVLCLPEGATAPVTTPTTPTTTPPTGGGGGGTVVPLAAFPVQGPCGFIDTWGAVRSGGRRHEGVDIIAKTGQFVYAVRDGKLTKQAHDKPGQLSGNAWWLTAADGTYFFYGHLSGFAPDLGVGSPVKAGQIIGYIGMTGSAATPHLHFEIHPGGGSAINPTPSVKAVDGCATTAPLPQPGGAAAPGPTAPAGPTATTPAAPPTNGVSSQTGGGWQFVPPVTALDTSWTGTRVPGGLKKQVIRVDGLKGVPATTPGVMVRLVTRSAAASGFLVVHPCDGGPPGTATLSFSPSTSAVGSAMVEVVAGTICVSANVAVGLKLEVIAHRSTAGAGMRSIPSLRALDTRTSQRLGRGVTATIPNASLGASGGAQALSATITVVSPAASGTLSIGFCGSGGWNVPVGTDAIWSFSIAMRVSPTGWCVTSTVPMDVVVDVTAVWAGGAPSPVPLDPARLFDSRTTGVRVGQEPVAVAVAGQGGVPWSATTAVLAFSTVSGDKPGIVFAVPCSRGRSDGVVTASAPRRIITAIVPVALADGWVCLSAIEPVDVIVDVVAAG